MDKVLLGALDIESLFKWRDAHKEEVRSNPMPVRDLEIICKDSNVKVKCIREPERLRMWVSVSRLWVSPQVGIWQRIIPTSTVARKFGRCFRTASLFRHQYFATRLLQLIQRGRILAALTRFWGKRIALQKKLWISPATNLLPEVRRPLFYGIRPKIHAFLL